MADNLHDRLNRLIQELQEIKSLYAADTPMRQEIANEFPKLKELLRSDEWPVAVSEHLICDRNSNEDKLERAYTIIDLMIDDPDFKNKRFLDFGCGEGQTVKIAESKLSVGYDLKEQNWPTSEGSRKWTTTWDEVVRLAPYDVVLIFDVLDHVEGESPVEMLSRVASVLSPVGKIYLRSHPWTSRHATHLYYDLNKAYVHLIFTPEEMAELGLPASAPNIEVKRPMATYKSFFDAAGLKIQSCKEITEPANDFFRREPMQRRLMQRVQINKFPDWQMSLQFIDYILSK